MTTVQFQVPKQKIGPVAAKVLELAISDPKLSQVEIARRVHTHQTHVSKIFKSLRFMNLLRDRARTYVPSLIPKALYAFERCITQEKNWSVKLDASTRLLEDQSVVNKNGLDLNITNRYDGMKPDELFSIVQNAKAVLPSVVDAEVVT